MADYYTPESVVNEAFDAAALDFTIGDLNEGTRPAQVAMRKYSTCMKQLLRTAHWGFSRKQSFLQLVADASGNTPNVGTLVPGPFTYSYNMPSDCLKVRYIPARYWNNSGQVPTGNIVPQDSSAPLLTNMTAPPLTTQRIIPTRFLVTTDVNNLPDGAANDIPAISPVGQTLILTNQQDAVGVYTFEANWPNLWDELFRNAMVAFLASEIVLPLAADKKFGMTMRERNIAIAKEKIREARATSANEAWNDSTQAVDWMRVRASGGFSSAYGWGGGIGPGYLFGGYDGIWFENSSAY